MRQTPFASAAATPWPLEGAAIVILTIVLGAVGAEDEERIQRVLPYAGGGYQWSVVARRNMTGQRRKNASLSPVHCNLNAPIQSGVGFRPCAAHMGDEADTQWPDGPRPSARAGYQHWVQKLACIHQRKGRNVAFADFFCLRMFFASTPGLRRRLVAFFIHVPLTLNDMRGPGTPCLPLHLHLRDGGKAKFVVLRTQ